MFGSDLPCTRAPLPYTDADVQLIVDALGVEWARQVLSENARHFYRRPACP
jgi:predicted TIM-barrel fold metal-dependent hydrolase